MKIIIDPSFPKSFDWKKALIEKIQSCNETAVVGNTFFLCVDGEDDLVVHFRDGEVYFTAPG